ncbi:MAG TPA: circularly permuted type 2 ATP-grasp protein [Polyangiaceae bacterium]|nr:circularly permuted type 2 ATP-grasp protein [Polyangiaceae bacterium]
MTSAIPAGSPTDRANDPFSYPATATGRDEAFDTNGVAHEHTAPLLRSLAALGVDEMQRRWDQARRLIRDNGVTYNVYGDPRGMDRPWELDPVPMVLPSAEWAAIARGLAQRAELLNRILLDLYGPQNLLARGLLPPELVLGSPGYLRPLRGVQVPSNTMLHLYGADLARAPDGGFRVLGDRTQAPSGGGYALENRIVLSRTMPRVFRDCRVQRLASHYRSLRDTLRGLAPRARESPRIVLLTPGPHNETYFEHAYLARYLGFALVEGADLTVRDRRVYVKTLGGLERVDVILRRLDDAFCDPLSLRSDSSLGVAGLVHAVRAGHVAVANALGSGVVETPAILGFLPGLCRELLGEDLRLPSVHTWWCGEPSALSHVLDQLPKLVLKPTFWSPSAPEPVFAGRLSSAELDALRVRIRAKPEAYVAQEQVALSTAPAWTRGRLEPRHVAIRAYVASTSHGFQVMPGGLTRVAATEESLVVSMQRGAGSKDLWVLAENEEVNPVTLLRTPAQRVEILRSGGDLPSRVADNLFWLGRYMERAEGTVRLMRSLIARLTDDSVPGEVPELPTLLRALEVNGDFDPGTLITPTGTRAGGVDLSRALFADHPPHALRATVTAGHRAASVVRDRLSSDTWHVVSRIHRLLDDASRRPAFHLSDAFDLLGELLLLFSALSGLSRENMTHGPGWRFSDMGRRVERLHHTVRLLRGILVPADEDDVPALEALLEIADSIITYRTRYLGAIEVAPVLDLLLTDESNPRSVAYQLLALDEHIAELPRARRSATRPEEARIVLRALARVQLADVHALSAVGTGATRETLDAQLAELEHVGPALAESLTRSYLTHAEPTQSLDGLT